MPHRVTNFIKSSTNSLENQVFGLKKKQATATDAPPRRKPRKQQGRPSRSSERFFSYASSTEDEAEESLALPLPPSMRRMVEAASVRHASSTNSSSAASSRLPSPSAPVRDQQNAHQRKLSFPSLHLGRSSRESHANSHSHAALTTSVESPPVVFYGPPDTSTGALVAGQFFLDVTRPEGLEFESLSATLSIHTTHKKPFNSHCQDCATRVTELRTWSFLDRPLFLTKGQHAFPFSALLEGQLPTSMDGPLVAVSYHLKAEAVSKLHGSPLPTIKTDRRIDVKRSIGGQETPHHSVRVFPPTNVKATVEYPHVIHPIGSNTMSLRLDGIAKNNDKAGMVEYWKLKKLTWRLEETTKSVAPPCAKHAPKDASSSGIQRTDTRTIGEKTMFEGWKSTYASPSDSLVEMELDYHLSRHARFSCAAKTRDGLEVTHQFMVEMVVSQELAPAGKPSQSTPTGIGRILRMHFGTILTERAGIGISWDNEAPPIYQDVPPSPPAYPGGGSTNPMDVYAWEHGVEPLDGVAASGTTSRCSLEGGEER